VALTSTPKIMISADGTVIGFERALRWLVDFLT
jgi:hypothetical protein